jgi:acyl-CoA synthetase (AMP-forming)/AMP-acid ligase II
MTELCSQVATQRDIADDKARLHPLPGIEVRENKGILEVRAPQLFSGYLGQDGLQRPVDTDGWFSTGDCGSTSEEGGLQVLGRRGELIITGGENVSPLEVEAALEELPGVQQACVVGIPDERWGQRVVALLVLRPERKVCTDELNLAILAPLRQRLAGYKCPRSVLQVETLPLLANGKRDRRQATLLAQARLTLELETANGLSPSWHKRDEGERPDELASPETEGAKGS